VKANLTALGRALLEAGIVSEDDIPPQQIPDHRPALEREEKSFPSVPFEAPPSGRIVEGPKEPPPPLKEQDEEDDRSDVPRRRGHMVWLHKTAPVFQFDDDPTLTPEDYEKGRRR
jgi:hypothetical protein